MALELYSPWALEIFYLLVSSLISFKFSLQRSTTPLVRFVSFFSRQLSVILFVWLLSQNACYVTWRRNLSASSLTLFLPPRLQCSLSLRCWVSCRCITGNGLLSSSISLRSYGNKESLQCLYNFKACCMLHYMTSFRETALDCWEECAFCSLNGMPYRRLLILFDQYYHLIEVSLFLFIFIFVRMTCQLVRVEESCYF